MPRQRATNAVEIEGLKEFQKALKQLDGEWPKALSKTNEAAAKIVSDEATSSADSQGGVAAKVAPSIKAGKTAREATVSIGGAGFPMALGAEFGAKQYPQFKPFLGNQWEGDGGPGYILDPAVRKKAPQFAEAYGKMIDDLARRAFPQH